MGWIGVRHPWRIGPRFCAAIPKSHIARIEAAMPAEGWTSLDADTHMSPGSLEAALRGVGGCTAAVDAVMAGEVANAFVAMRPPGHHAENETRDGLLPVWQRRDRGETALDHHGLSRVAIVDFDVHHGNGTQDLLWDEARVRFVSTHQMPLYPGSGASHEVGAHGQITNVPLNPGSGGVEMRAAYDRVIIPMLEEFAPELVLISAGFDAAVADPLANLNWTTEDFAWVTRRICDVAEAHSAARVVSTLEGGYDLDALADAVAAHVQVLMERGG